MYKTASKIRRRFAEFRKHPLTSKNYVRTCTIYILTNIRLRISKEINVKWLEGLRFYVRRGDAGIIANIYYGLYEYRESLFLLHVLRKEDHFLDIGANVGHFSLLVSGLKGCRSIAVEPIPETFLQLERNIRLNQLGDRVKSFNLGFSREKSFLYFSTDRGTMNRVVSSDYGDKVHIGVTTLDSFLNCRDLPFAIKIDAEGYEKFILEGGHECLTNPEVQVLIVEINEHSLNYNVEKKEILEVVQRAGFQPYDYDPWTRHIHPLESYNHNQYNSLFIKDLYKVNQRIKSSKKIKLGKYWF